MPEEKKEWRIDNVYKETRVFSLELTSGCFIPCVRMRHCKTMHVRYVSKEVLKKKFKQVDLRWGKKA